MAHARLADSASQDVFAVRRLIMRVQKGQPLTEGDMQRLIRFRSEALLSLILSQGCSYIPITSRVVRLVKQYLTAITGTNAMDVIELILRKCPAGLMLEDSVVSTILDGFDEPQRRSLWQSWGERIRPTDSVVRTAVGLGDHGVAVLKLLFAQWEGLPSLSLPEDLALVVLRSPKAQKDGVELILERHLGDIDLTDDIAIATLRNKKHGLAILEGLKSYQGGEVHVKLTSYGLEEVVRSETHGATTLGALGTLKKHGPLYEDDGGITPTTDTLIAAVSNQRQGLEIFKMLAAIVDRFRTLPITEGVLEADIESRSPQNFLKVALDQLGAFPINDEALFVAVVQSWRSHQNPALVLRRFGHIRSVLSRVFQAAAGCPDADTVLEYFYENFGEDIQMTEDVIIAAIRGSKSYKALKVLSSTWGSEGQITEKVMIETAKLGIAHDAVSVRNFLVLEAICLDWGMNLPVTERVVEAAAGSRQGTDALKFLVDRIGTVCEITE